MSGVRDAVQFLTACTGHAVIKPQVGPGPITAQRTRCVCVYEPYALRNHPASSTDRLGHHHHLPGCCCCCLLRGQILPLERNIGHVTRAVTRVNTHTQLTPLTPHCVCCDHSLCPGRAQYRLALVGCSVSSSSSFPWHQNNALHWPCLSPQQRNLLLQMDFHVSHSVGLLTFSRCTGVRTFVALACPQSRSALLCFRCFASAIRCDIHRTISALSRVKLALGRANGAPPCLKHHNCF
jgi:hypothetical protein